SLVFECRSRGVHAAIRLKLPELAAVGFVERSEAAIVTTDKDEPPTSHDGAAVALIHPLLAPDELVGSDVDHRKHASAWCGEALHDAARVQRARLDGIPRIASDGPPQRIGGADVHEMRFGIIR